MNILMLFLFGGLGTISRFFVYHIIKVMSLQSYIATMFVNILGTVFFALFLKFVSGNFSENIKFFVFTGFMGAFTTFSAFIFDNVQFFNQKQYFLMFFNFFVQFFVSFMLFFVIIKK